MQCLLAWTMQHTSEDVNGVFQLGYVSHRKHTGRTPASALSVLIGSSSNSGKPNLNSFTGPAVAYQPLVRILQLRHRGCALQCIVAVGEHLQPCLRDLPVLPHI